MATNFKQDGKAIYTVTASGMTAGQPIVLGNHLPGVLLTAADSTDSHKATVGTEGIYNLSVWAWDGSARSAVAIGDALYWDGVTANPASRINKDVSKKFFGVAMETLAHGDADNTTGTIAVLLNPKVATPATVDTSDIADGSVTSDKINAGVLQTVTKSFSAAQIKTLYSANTNKGLEILAAPGANKLIEFVSAALWYDYDGTNAYTAANGLTFTLDGTAVSALVATTLLQATADRAAFCEALSTGANAAASALLNKKLFLQEGTADPTGSATMAADQLKVIVTYRIHDFA
jgi:predicted RecA/RadA family phage recombinase